MAGKFISSNSTVRAKVAALQAEKRLVRDIEAKMVEHAVAEAATKKEASDHRIATKMAKIHGHEPPPPIVSAPAEVEVVAPPAVEPEVAPEPAPKKAPAKKAPAKKAAAKKAAPKKSPRKKG
jgi:hypothetical protein